MSSAATKTGKATEACPSTLGSVLVEHTRKHMSIVPSRCHPRTVMLTWSEIGTERPDDIPQVRRFPLSLHISRENPSKCDPSNIFANFVGNIE